MMSCVYLADDVQNKFVQRNPYTKIGFFPNLPKELSYNSGVISFIKEKHNPIFAEELTARVKKEFNLRSGLIVPSFMREKLLGFLLLGPKSSGAIYTQDDVNAFEVLANQASLAIENTEFIAEFQRTQSRLFATERMTSLGTMAGGMSHQLNNRFHAIIMATSDTIDTLKLINLENASKEELKDYFKQITHALTRIQENAKLGGKIVNNFLNFSQPDRMQKEAKSFSLKEPLEQAIEMVRIKTSLSEDMIERDIQEDLPQIQGDFVLLQDVFFNLIDNATDALSRKDKAIKDKELLASSGYKGKIVIRIFKSDSNITVQIQDNGIGMPEEVRKRLFVPFFTTKATSAKGTGLGLFVIQKIINVHQGQIQVSSEYGQGTTFTINLPINK
jgi:signal transduction histidine kinase